MFGVPGLTPIIFFGLGLRVKKEDNDFDLSSGRRNFFHINIACVPVAQGVPDIYAILNGGREFFGTGQVVTQ